jgi:PEP-CTERM motif
MLRSTRIVPAISRVLGWGLLAAGLSTVAVPAQALTISATYDSTITSDPNSAAIMSTIGTAINFYQTVITNPITVNIKFAEMTSGLGQSLTSYSTVNYSSYLTALQSHSSGNATDTSALASLPGGSNEPVTNGAQIATTLANLRALGLRGAPSGNDSTISINTGITNYTGKTFDPSYYSLLAVVEHEMDEALGVGSDLNNGGTSTVWAEDLFRYAAAGTRSYSTSSSATAYFSVNGGVTNIAGFNQSGGGSDYNDWDGSTVRVQNAYGTPGATLSLDLYSPEVKVLDAIGYNFTAVPEPASFGMVGLGALALFLRRRHAAK